MEGPTSNTLSTLVAEAARVFALLLSDLSGPRGFRGFLDELGVPDGLVDDVTMLRVFEALTSVSDAVRPLLPVAGNVGAIPLDKIPSLIDGVRETYAAVGRLSTLTVHVAQDPGPIQDFGPRILAHIVLGYLRRYHPAAGAALCLFGVIDAGNTASAQIENRLPTLRIDRLFALLRDPVAVVRDALAWDSGSMEVYRALFSLQQLLLAYGIPCAFDALETKADGPRLPGQTAGDLQLHIPLTATAAGSAEARIAILPIRNALGQLNGFQISLLGLGQSKKQVLIGPWVVEYDLSTNAAESTALIFSPGALKVRDAQSGGLIANAAFGATLRRSDAPAPLLLGAPDIGQLEFGDLIWRVDIKQNTEGAEYSVQLTVKEGRLTLHPGSADGFVAKMLPAAGMSASFSLVVGWAQSEGLYFHGGSGLELSIPIPSFHTDLLSLSALTLGLVPTTDCVEMKLIGGATARLGPLTATVEGLGLVANIKSSASGNLGPVDLSVEFAPPTRVGLSIDTGAIVGGGYLGYDSDKKEYFGILQLEIANVVAVQAVGLISTVLPNGITNSFSLLIIVSAQFPPIQIGFGFTLSGVGGLIGINRRVNVEAFADGMKNGTIGSVLFPVDPVANASRIISDLRALFPPIEGRHVVGLMAEFGWGTPALLTMELGILIELPQPVRVVLLGKLSAYLPSPATPIVRLRMDLLGVIDFSLKEADVTAVLHDSKIAQYPIRGEMAMRNKWGSQPDFVLAIGGFNPRFEPPEKFQVPRRVEIDICDKKRVKIGAEAYFAITSNTVQFGGRAAFYASKHFRFIGTLSASGHLGLDALIQFKPRFHVTFDLSAGVSIKHNGHTVFHASVSGTLSGPGPWHVRGKAAVHFCGKHKISFDTTFGSSTRPPLATSQEPCGLLAASLQDRHCWSAHLADNEHSIVTLREIAVGDEVLVHPLGVISLRQNLLPLGILLDKVQGGYLAKPRKFIVDVSFGSAITGGKAQELRGYFAAGQFIDMNEDKQLSRPAFELMPCGYGYPESGGALICYGKDSSCDYIYRTVIVDDPETKKTRHLRSYNMSSTVLANLASHGAAARSRMRTTGSAKFMPRHSPKNKVQIAEPAYVVVDTASLKTHPDSEGAKQPFATQAQARAWCKKRGLPQSQWRVVESYEAVMQ